jgi:hypothetical protein
LNGAELAYLDCSFHRGVKRMQKTCTLSCVLFLSLSLICIAAERKQCSRDEAIQAEAEAAHLKDRAPRGTLLHPLRRAHCSHARGLKQGTVYAAKSQIGCSGKT